MYYIYLVKHKETGKCYVGWTAKEPSKRWQYHLYSVKYGSQTYFHKALRKYGQDEFEWSVIQEYKNLDQSKQAEIDYIKYLRSKNIQLYNMTDGGDGSLGVFVSEETRIKLRKANTGRKHTKEAIQNMRENRLGDKNPNYGNKTCTEQTRQKMSVNSRGENNNSAILKEEDVISVLELIRDKSNNHLTNNDIAKIYGVSKRAIDAISQGKSWKHIKR